MKQRLTHEVLQYLKSNGFTILVSVNVLLATGGAMVSEFIYTPVQWDVKEFEVYANIQEYNSHSFFIIDELLKIDLSHLNRHTVMLEKS